MATPVTLSAATGSVPPSIGQAPLCGTSRALQGAEITVTPDGGDPELSAASSRSLSAATTRAVAELMSSSPRVEGAVGVFCVT